jgi:hypothetical protein
MALRNAPDGLNRAQLMEYLEIEIASNLYDANDLAELQAKLVATRDMPPTLKEQGIETE